MNVAEASGFLAERFADLTESKFTASIKRLLLQNAELDLANKLNPAYLTELETEQTSVTVTTGSAALSLLTNNVLGGGQGIREVVVHSGKICRRIDPQKRKETESYFRTGSTEDPMFWVRHNKINVLPIAVTSIDVSYLKVPDPLYFNFALTQSGGGSTTVFLGDASQGLNETTNDYYVGAVIYCVEEDSYHVITDYVAATRTFTVTPAADPAFTTGQHIHFLTHDFDGLNLSGVDFTLNPSLHETILLLAEAAGWAQTEFESRRAAAWGRAIESINVLNGKYVSPEQLGTQAQGR